VHLVGFYYKSNYTFYLTTGVVARVETASFTVSEPLSFARQRKAPSSLCPCYGGDTLNAYVVA